MIEKAQGSGFLLRSSAFVETALFVEYPSTDEVGMQAKDIGVENLKSDLDVLQALEAQEEYY